MAAGGYKEFVAGETLDQDEINDYLMQGVLVFAGTAARGSAITAPVEGQFAFLKDSDALTFYDGSQWTELSTTPGAAVVSGTTGSPTLGTVSSGGTTYNVYSFTGDGSITFSEAGFAELLLVGGGGAGGIAIGGGGGGGGVLNISSAYFGAGTATVIVGAGGLAPTTQASNADPGDNGLPSSIGTYFAPGGGGGGAATRDGTGTQVYSKKGLSCGSGGGASGSTTGGIESGGLGVSGIGNDGGDGANLAGAGGGGAGAVGSTATSTNGGNGGAGVANSITGSSVTYGGGGGGYGTTSSGSGGSGGGGAAGVTGTNGTANTGGGSGGSNLSGTPATGSTGGSGIVIVRVAV